MAFLEVVRAGPYISVQDIGRPGFLRSGVSQGGAMDQRALEEGRLLVGNKIGLAVLEILGIGGRFKVHDQTVCLALTGAVFPANVDGKIIEPRTSFSLHPGETLEIGTAQTGNYGYLSVGGGIDTPPVLGSRSTHVRARFGGFEGHCVRPGDRLPLGETRELHAGYQLPSIKRPEQQEVGFLWGAQADLFSPKELRRFVDTKFQITHEQDRMGARLMSDAAPISSDKGLVAISGAIALGDIQVTGNGRPIVLLADRQPTGGYPRIGTIIAADIADFAQRRAGAIVRFRPVTEDQALKALKEKHDGIRHLPEQLIRNLGDPFESHKLLSQNLISGVVSTLNQPTKDRSS